MLVDESTVTDISVLNLRKRRIWLGEPGQRGYWTGDLSQLIALNPSEGKASSRSGRTMRQHKLLYSLRIFCKSGQLWDVPWWRPQHVTLHGDSRCPLQGFKQAEDHNSWSRYSRLNDAPPQLTEALGPPQGGLGTTLSKASPRPRASPYQRTGSVLPREVRPSFWGEDRDEGRAASRAASSSDGIWGNPGTRAKAEASSLFTLRLRSKGKPPENLLRVWPGQRQRPRSRSPRRRQSTVTQALGRGLAMDPSQVDATGRWVPAE